MYAKTQCLVISAAAILVLAGCDSKTDRGSSTPPPPATTYMVGGTAVGLAASGLVLQLNGGGNLPVGTNGPFVFTASLAAGAAYSVTVLAQPGGQACAVAGGTGTIVAANITSVAVSCVATTKAWGTPQAIEASPVTANSPEVGAAANGDAIAVWQQGANIYANSHVVSSGWGTPVILSSGANAAFPQIAVNSPGAAIAVWIQLEAGITNLHASRYTAVSGWSAAQSIESNAGSVIGIPAVAMDPAGNGIVVWEQQDTTQPSGGQYSIWASRYVAGSGWSAAEKISPDLLSAVLPGVAMSANGSVIATWEGAGLGTGSRIFANRLVGDSWTGSEAIETLGSGETNGHSIAIDAGGNAVLVYAARLSAWGIYEKRFVAGSGWTAAVLVSSEIDTAMNPRVAVDGNANVLATWRVGAGATAVAKGSRYSPGVGWAVPLVFGSPSPVDPRLAVSANGEAVVVWSQIDNGIHNLHANRFLPAAGWTGAEPIENIAGGTSPVSYSVAADDAGRFVVVWRDLRNLEFSIFANRFQ